MTDHALTHPITLDPGAAARAGAVRRPALLRRVFAVDRILSGASAVVLLAGAPWVGDLLDWPTVAVAGLGVVLALNTVLLEVVHRQADQDSALTRESIAIDLAFAAGLAVVLLGWPSATSTLGTWLLAATALLVVDVAIAKFIGLRRAR